MIYVSIFLSVSLIEHGVCSALFQDEMIPLTLVDAFADFAGSASGNARIKE
jgi:hypothetical protein